MLDGSKPQPPAAEETVSSEPNKVEGAPLEEAEKLRMEQAVYNAMLNAYGSQKSPEESNRIARVAIVRSAELIALALERGIEIPTALLEGVGKLLPELSSKSKDSFVLGKSTVFPIMKQLAATPGFENVDFGEIEEYTYLEKLMTKAAGGKKGYQAAIVADIGPALIGVTPLEVRQAFDNLIKFAKMLHDVQDAHHKSKTPNPEEAENAPEQVDELIDILEAQEFGAEDVIKKPFGVNDMLMLMDIEADWLSLNQPEKAQIINNMNIIADHFGLLLTVGPRGPEIIAAEK